MSTIELNFEDPVVIATLAISALVLTAFLGCFVVSWFCRWPKLSGSGADPLRLFMLPAALLLYILWSCLNISNLVVTQTVPDISASFYVIYVFEELCTYLAEILLALIIHKILFHRLGEQGAKDGPTTLLRYVVLALITVAFIMGAVVVGTQAKFAAVYIRYVDGGYTSDPQYTNWQNINEKVAFGYEICILIVLVVLLVVWALMTRKLAAKIESPLTLVALFAFFVQQLDGCVTDGYFAFGRSNSSSYTTTLHVSYSETIVYDIMAIVVVGCLVIIGLWSKSQLRGGNNMIPAQYIQNYPNYPAANSGGGYGYNYQSLQQQHGFQQQHYQPQNYQPYPQEMPHSRTAAYDYPTPVRPGELSSGIENQQFPNPPVSPQMLYAPTPQAYKA